MKKKKKLGLGLIRVTLVGGLVILSLLLAAGCAEEGTAPSENNLPNTLVTGYRIQLAPDSATTYNVVVSWSGSDVDGAVYWYYWRVRDVDGNLVMSTEATSDLTTQIRLDFPTEDTRYIFEVEAQDNLRGKDPTPATEIIAINRVRDSNFEPDTEILSGPNDGALTGHGIRFVVAGNDIDNAVTEVAYMVDGGVWTGVGANEFGIATIDVRSLTSGPHAVSFRAVDHFGGLDPSPASRSIVVVDTLYPELSLSVQDGQAFVVPFTEPVIAALTIEMTVEVAYYFSAVDSFVVETSRGDRIVTTEPSVALTDVGAGDYWVDVTVYDIGGNSTSSGHVDFSVSVLQADNGVLCVNGVDWGTYGSEAVDLWANGVPWGSRTHFKTWDLFTSTPIGDVPDFADSLLGTRAPLTWMFDTAFFEAVVWMYNDFGGDDAYWADEDLQAALMGFLNMGGNLLIGGRFADVLFGDAPDFSEYTAATVGAGVNPASAIAVHDSLADMAATGSHSLSVLVTTAHANATQLFTMPDGTPGLGWVVLPNGEGGGGAACFVGGRVYRWDNAEYKANIDVILRYFLGVN